MIETNELEVKMIALWEKEITVSLACNEGIYCTAGGGMQIGMFCLLIVFVVSLKSIEILLGCGMQSLRNFELSVTGTSIREKYDNFFPAFPVFGWLIREEQN